jgi:YVTN family beta-propeller protein
MDSNASAADRGAGSGNAAAGPGAGVPAEQIRTFLIADVRGYTRFTQERGDEAAGKLATKFAALAREGVEAAGGVVLELRGDEALAVFGSPRQALRAAVALEERFLEETLEDPAIPLRVGIGVDVGEAVAVEGGYRGGALNLAARLCAAARPGEILASREVVHLARKIEGITYVPRAPVRAKGLPEPAHAIKVVSEADDPAERFAALPDTGAEVLAPRARALARRYPVLHPILVGRRPLVVAVALAVVVVTIASLVVMRFAGAPGPRSIAANAVGLIDLDTGELAGEVEVGARPGGVAFGGGAVWVTNGGDGTVSRIDPATNAVVDTIQVGLDPIGVAFGNGALWVTTGAEATVSRIDPETGTVVQDVAVGNGPVDIAVGHGAVWVANRYDDTVSRVDPTDGTVTATIDVGDGPSALAVHGGGIWVTNQLVGTVSRIDPDSNEVVGEINVGSGPQGLAGGDGALWVANGLDGTVSRIDPTTGAVIATIRVGDGPGDVALSPGAVWVANEFGASLSRVDPDTNAVVQTVGVGSAPEALAVIDDALWVASRASGGGHRGGILRLQPDGMDTIDPALGFSEESWQLLSATNDGLVDFRRAGGAQGAILVPNLALSLPTPTDGGTSYTFRLRDNVRYSTGKEVKASDLRRAIERVFVLRSLGAGFYRGIVGAAGCEKTPARCDLSRGIVTDDAERTVTFKLGAPDAEFLYKLTLPFAYPVPPGTPAQDVGAKPVPATGPYMIADYEPRAGIELVRNPNFKQWSAAAQPDGYADEVVLRFGAQVTDVQRNDADWTGVPDERLDEIRTRYADQVRVFVRPHTNYMALNTRAAPFDDVRARRALNYAVDRKRVVAVFGGADQAAATCQVLPSNYPGYKRYCPYTLDPDELGRWRAPDMKAARRLVRESGTGGMKVTVWELQGHFWPDDLGDYFVTLLERLGYEASLKSVTDIERYFGTVHDSRKRVQIAVNGWVADYPSASSFIRQTLTCDGFAPASPRTNSNAAAFCNPAIDRLVDRASQLQVTNPPAARKLWAEIDAKIVDQAPWVFLVNPRGAHFVSERAGNYQYHPMWGMLIDQLWVE